MGEGAGGPLLTPDMRESWLGREKNLLQEIDQSISYYSSRAWTARICHRTVGVVVLVGSVFAPVAVASSAGTNTGLELFSIDGRHSAQIALIITVVLALCEGLRRFYQFDQRWMTCVQAREELRRLRNNYQDEQIGSQVGSEPWVNRFYLLRKDAQEVRSQEEVGFFQRLRSASEVPGKSG
jgi:hypothetical protein